MFRICSILFGAQKEVGQGAVTAQAGGGGSAPSQLANLREKIRRIEAVMRVTGYRGAGLRWGPAMRLLAGRMVPFTVA